MRKKPVFLYVASLLFFAAPLLVSGALYLQVPSTQDFLEANGDPIQLLFYWACWTAAVSTWRIQIWGYYSYYLSTLLIVLLQIQRFIFGDLDSLAMTSEMNLMILAFGVLLYKVQLLTEPFVNPQARWWETPTRYSVDLKAQIRGRKADMKVRILDISETGFFAEHEDNIAIGSIFGVDIIFQTTKIHTVGMVVRNSKAPQGVGFMFLAATRSEKSAVKQLVLALEAAARGAEPMPIILDDDDQGQIAA
ncbi:MAG: PilZ domain-containing protein [Bdellovibrionales bacterium]